jgi:hypothetical protein
MNWACPQPRRGVRSTRLRVPAQALCGPSADAGATSNGLAHEIFVARAVASTSMVSSVRLTGKLPMSPRVLRRAQSSSAA